MFWIFKKKVRTPEQEAAYAKKKAIWDADNARAARIKACEDDGGHAYVGAQCVVCGEVTAW